MKKVTQWLVYIEQRKWEHNHLEDGHVSYTQQVPTSLTPQQEKAWKNELWVRIHCYLNEHHEVVNGPCNN